MSRTRRHLQAGTRPESGVLLEVEDLKTYFETALGVVKAVDGVSFSLARGPVARHRGRVRFGQDHPLPLDHGPAAQAQHHP